MKTTILFVVGVILIVLGLSVFINTLMNDMLPSTFIRIFLFLVSFIGPMIGGIALIYKSQE